MTRWAQSTGRLVRDHRREAGVASVGLIGVLLATGLATLHQPAPTWPTAEATRGLFRETVVETGTIGAARLMLYSSTIAGAQAKIIEIVAEGTAVKVGDVLVRFDSVGFEQSLARELAALGQARNELTRASEEARLDELRARGEIESSRQQVTWAESGLVNQLEGRGKLNIAEAEAGLSEAVREADRLKTAYEDLRPLLAAGFVTRAELERAGQEWRRAEDQKTLAESRRDTLVRYEGPAAAGRSQSELSAAREGLVRQGETIASRHAERTATVAAQQSHVAEVQARVAMLRDQIARTTVRASSAGLVVYRDLFFGSDKRKPQVGDEVWPNQPLIALPDAAQLIVDTRVREIDLHKIAASQKVSVTVDAYPDLRLPASVALIGALAQEDAARAATKFFPVTVKLLSTDPRLRTGMTAQVEIEIATIPNAITVPVQAIFDHGSGPFVFVPRGSQVARRPVTVIGANESLAAVAQGVVPGERLLLVDPDTEGAATSR